MTKSEYLLFMLEMMLLFKVLHNAFLFRCIRDLSASYSELLFRALIGIFFAAGALLSKYTGRSNCSALMYTVLPYGFYTLIACFHDRPAFSIAVLLVLLFLPAAWYILQRALTGRVGFRRMLRFGLCTSAAVLAFSLIPPVFGKICQTPFFSKSVTAVYAPTGEEHTIANHLEDLVIFSEQEWNQAALKDRQDALQIVANIEARYLGLPHELNVCLAALPDNINGNYQDQQHLIRINVDFLEEAQPYDVLTTICHEAYHAYQARLCDVFRETDEDYRNLLIFEESAVFLKELTNYEDGTSDLMKYYNQYVESSARSYGRESAYEYLDRIEAYLDERG